MIDYTDMTPEAAGPVLCIVGAGGHGRVVLDVARSMKKFSGFLFLDGEPALHGTQIMGVSVAGADDALPEPGPDIAVACGIGMDNPRRLALVREWLGAKHQVPTLIHATAWVSEHAEVGAGTVIMAQAAVNTGAKIAEGAVINTGACVDHDCRIGAGVHLAPGVHLSGNVTIGERTLMGTGSCAIQGRIVGHDCEIGAGSVVVQDIPPHRQAFGVPAKPIQVI